MGLSSEKLRVLSLFSGCGGMDLGFEGGFSCLARSVNEEIHPDWVKEKSGDFCTLVETCFDTVFANDIRSGAKAAWVSYLGRNKEDANSIYSLESIVDLVKKAKSGEYEFPKDIDVITGGFPCNDYSVAGKREGFGSSKSHTGETLSDDDPTEESRGKLYMWMREVITLVEPKMFVAENVKGLVSLGNVKEIIEHDFSSAGSSGYLVVPAKVLYAPNYGVPQSRERVIFFGFNKDYLTDEALQELSQDKISLEYDPYPMETHGKDLKKVVSCREAFVGLEEPDESDDPAQQKYSKLKYLGPSHQGQNEVKIDGVGPTIRAEHHGNIEYRRLSKEHGGKHTEELDVGLEERRLSVRECARIQTFPDDYQFILDKTDGNVAVSASEAYRLIGNAVPPVLAYNIAKNLEAKWSLFFGCD